MIPRWNSVVDDIKAFVKALNELVKKNFKRSKRGRKPKHNLRSYFKLIVAKEAKKASLRMAERDYSKAICKSRVDHSVIHYWERRFDINLIERLVKALGEKVEGLLDYTFSILDSTKFTTWARRLPVEFHLLIRKAEETIYPVFVRFGPIWNSIELPKGKGELLADSWYDSNHLLKAIFKAGYQPVVKPSRERGRGYWRRKARKLWNNPWIKLQQKYRRRSIGESIFGSLVNWLGDRLKTSLIATTITRIGARIIAYLVRISLALLHASASTNSISS